MNYMYDKIRYIFIFSQNLENPVHSKPSLYVLEYYKISTKIKVHVVTTY
jgi:hypothetical protein